MSEDGLRRRLKQDQLEVDGHHFSVEYFEITTPRGLVRYVAEITLDDLHHVILDADSLEGLEGRVATLAPATLYSRKLDG